MRSHVFFLIVLSLLLPALSVVAGETAGQLVKVEGKVVVFRGDSVRGETAGPTTTFAVGDRIQTSGNSKAFVRFEDGGKVVLLDDSTLSIKGLDQTNVDKGKVLFEIKKRGQAKGLNVTAATVTMGVRGTRFAVSNTDRKVSIFLKEGELEIASLSGDFKRVHRALREEFDAMRRQMREEFEKTRDQMQKEFEDTKRQMARENVEIVREFLMQAGSAVRIVMAGNEVKDTETPKEIEEAFELLDTF